MPPQTAGSEMTSIEIRETLEKERDFSLITTGRGLPGSGWLAAEPKATPQIPRLRPWGFPAVSPSHPRVHPQHDRPGITAGFGEDFQKNYGLTPARIPRTLAGVGPARPPARSGPNRARRAARGGAAVRWLSQVAALGVAGINRQWRDAAPAPRGAVVLAAVGEEAGAVGQQERPEPALARGRPPRRCPAPTAGRTSPVSGQGLIGTAPLAADEGVERIPVDGAQIGQCRVRLGRGPIPGRDHPAPARRWESGRRGVAFHRGRPYRG